MAIRRVRSDEGPKFQELVARIPPGEALSSGLQFEWADAEAFVSLVSGWATGTRTATLVAENDDGRWVGTIHCLLDGRSGTISGLWVDPTHRGHGIGKLLVDGIVAWARNAGTQILDLWVEHDNEPAKGTYAACGFVDAGDAAAAKAARAGLRKFHMRGNLGAISGP